MYSVKSATTEQACKDLGYIFEVRFVATRKGSGNTVYVRGTAGRPSEHNALQYACREINGTNYVYKG